MKLFSFEPFLRIALGILVTLHTAHTDISNY